jgi:von Willebrand factor type A domain
MAPHLAPRSPALLILLALLLPLIAACGGAPASAPLAAAPTRPPVAASGGMAATAAPAAAAPTAAAEPTAAAVSFDSAPKPADVAGEAPIGAPTGSGEPAAVAAMPTRPPEAAGIATAPTAPPIANTQQQYTPLKAGEVDDNIDFGEYMNYLRSAGGIRAHAVDVSERYILSVTNSQQQPVLDARVRIFDGQQQVFEGRTYAGGKTIFFPSAIGLAQNTQRLRVLIEKGNSSTEGQLTRGQDESPSFVLPNAEALPKTPHLDVLFLLDATGSMGDEISQIQQTIVSIAERIDRIQPRPQLRFGLVSYRDRGDDYVTRVNDFTPNVDEFRALLMNTGADGGGDDPESLNEGLHAAIQRVGWADDAVRLTFLVADAPPHLDYAQDYDYVAESQAAVSKGIKVYTIAASNSGDEAEYIMRQISQQTLARFIFLTYQQGQNAGTPGDTTVHQVDPDNFTVERLDDLVVQTVQRELALAQGIA